MVPYNIISYNISTKYIYTVGIISSLESIFLYVTS